MRRSDTPRDISRKRTEVPPGRVGHEPDPWGYTSPNGVTVRQNGPHTKGVIREMLTR